MGDLNPITREEYFLAKMAGENIEIPDPITREEKYMKGIADAISGQNDINIPEPITREEIYAEQIVKNLEEITFDLEEKSITENGEYTAAADNKDGFSKVTVNVPNTYTNEDEGKVVSSGTLVSQSARSENITENGTYDTTMNNAVTVAVAGGNANIANGTGAFKLNSSLNRINIPSGYTSIYQSALSSYTSLTSVDLPSTLTSIGNQAFNGCSSLTSIDLPSGVTSIGTQAFYNCRSLTSIGLPNTLTNIGTRAFNNCRSLTSIDLPSGVTSIGINVFTGCEKLTSINLPSELVSIDNSAFYGCEKLASIDLPNTLTSIGDFAFRDCTSLTSIICRATTPPTLGEDILMNVPADCAIYVPAESVDAYKAASEWSNRADYIQAIPTT